MSYICNFQEEGKLRSRFCTIVKSANVIGEEVNIFFQYFNRDIIIMNITIMNIIIMCFNRNIIMSFFFFLLKFLVSLISIFSTVLKEKEPPLYAPCIAVMLGCLLYFFIDFNVGQDILSDCRSMLLDSRI